MNANPPTSPVPAPAKEAVPIPFDYKVQELRKDPKVIEEELRRAMVADKATTRLVFLVKDLQLLTSKDLRGKDPLEAVISTSVRVLELALQTKGNLRVAKVQGDAFLEVTAANVLTGLRHALTIMEQHDSHLGCWDDALEVLKPVQDDLKRISTGIERPGIKSAISMAGGSLFDAKGQPTADAAAAVGQE